MLVHVEAYSKDWTPGNPPQTQLHASLAASTSSDRLLTIGRKAGDVLLPEDRSISREHVILRVSSTKNREKTTHASTPEEIAACEEDEDALCLVLNSVGKLGTYLAIEGDRVHSIKSNGEDSSETDATDDEEAVQVSQREQNPVPLSAATRHLFRGRSVRLKEVSSATLISLSKSGGRAVLQCGKLGSTIVLTRKVIEVLVSGKQAHGYSEWKEANFYKLGLREAKHFIVGQTSMVLTQSRSVVLKQVAAWSLNLPIVNFDFLYSYLHSRKSPSDPLFPLNPKDFAPTKGAGQFWDNPADPKLLSSCTLLSTAENDMECLAKAAGAEIKKLYDEGTKTSNEEMIKRAQLILDSTPHCFGIVENRPKKLDKELQSKAELRLVKSKDLTCAIVEQVLPKDTEGKIVGRIKSQQISLNERTDAKEEDRDAIEAGNEATVDAKEGSDATPIETDDQVTSEMITEGDESYEDIQSSAVTTANPPCPQALAHEKNATSEKSQDVQNSKRSSTAFVQPEETRPVQKRRKLGTASMSGWFTAAPKDRSAYRKSREELAAELGSPVREAAVTVICPDLIVPNNQKPSVRTRNSSGRDFRAFRKNRVPDVIQPQIKLRSVLPRESEQIQEYEEQETSLAKQRMRADDLFKDPVQR